MSLGRFRLWLWILVAAALAGAVTLQMTRPKNEVSAPEVATVGIEFSLITQDRRPKTWGDFRGKPTLVFFGFTHCPEICPTTLANLSTQLAELGERGDDLNVVFITVDPERDTPQVLSDYMSAFDKRITALTGSEQEVERTVKTFKAYRGKVRLEGGGYTMDHTTMVFLFTSSGSLTGTLDRHEKQEDQAKKIQRLIKA